MTRYRLAVLIDSVEFAGAERVMENVLRGLPPDVEVALIGPHRSTLDAIAANRPRTAIHVTPTRFTAARLALRRAAPDVVHANLTTFTSCRAGVFAALSLRIPTVLVDHAPGPGLTWKGRTLQRAVTRLCAARVSVADNASRLVERFGGLRPGSVATIVDGVPVASARRSSAEGGPVVLGALARLEPPKGLDVLIRAIAAVSDAHVVIAGDGSRRAELETLALSTGVADRVTFLGFQRDTCAVLDAIEVLVAPSRSDTLPLAILEAMQAGLPVVATRVGSIPEAVSHDVTGLLVPSDDVDALAAALKRVVSCPQLRARLGHHAYVRARDEFSAERMAAEYDALYAAVARNAAGR
jgi:L-malate glycosyltransferase